MNKKGILFKVMHGASLLALVLLLVMPALRALPAQAAALTALSDTMTRLKTSFASGHTIRFTTPTGASDNTDTIIITFPTDFNFTSKTIGTVSFTHGASTGAESTETLAASPSGSDWGAVFSGTQNRILTLTAPSDGVGAAALAASDKVIITYDSSNSTNGSTATTYLITVSGTFGDTGTIAVSLVTDDQIPVTGTVDPTVTFTVSTSALALGTLATGSISGSSPTSNITIATNGSGGYTISVQDQGNGSTAGLYSAGAAYLVGTSTTTLSAGTEGYGGQCNKVSGDGTCIYSGTGGDAVTAFSRTAITFASHASKPTGTATYTAKVKAAISTATAAGSYADTLTFIGTANF